MSCHTHIWQCMVNQPIFSNWPWWGYMEEPVLSIFTSSRAAFLIKQIFEWIIKTSTKANMSPISKTNWNTENMKTDIVPKKRQKLCFTTNQTHHQRLLKRWQRGYQTYFNGKRVPFPMKKIVCAIGTEKRILDTSNPLQNEDSLRLMRSVSHYSKSIEKVEKKS